MPPQERRRALELYEVHLIGVVFALELTKQFDAVLPLVIGATTAFAVSVLLLKRWVLTEKIARRGFHLTRDYDVDPLEVLFVSELMSVDLLEIEDDITVTDALSALGSPAEGDDDAWRLQLYPVVDREGRLRGIVTRRELFAAQAQGDGSTPMAELARKPIATTHGDQAMRHRCGLGMVRTSSSGRSSATTGCA